MSFFLCEIHMIYIFTKFMQFLYEPMNPGKFVI